MLLPVFGCFELSSVKNSVKIMNYSYIHHKGGTSASSTFFFYLFVVFMYLGKWAVFYTAAQNRVALLAARDTLSPRRVSGRGTH